MTKLERIELVSDKYYDLTLEQFKQLPIVNFKFANLTYDVDGVKVFSRFDILENLVEELSFFEK